MYKVLIAFGVSMKLLVVRPFKMCSSETQYNVTCFGGVTIDGGWIGEWIFGPLGTTSSYSATATLHNSQITTAPDKPFSSLLSTTAVP
jgi:hypothetical protein